MQSALAVDSEELTRVPVDLAIRIVWHFKRNEIHRTYDQVCRMHSKYTLPVDQTATDDHNH